MKTWTSTITYSVFDMGRECGTEEEYKEWVKQSFREEHNIELTDQEITDIEFEECLMNRDITEVIDDDCRDQLGHSNWVILSTLSDQEKVGIETQGILKTYKGVDVLFYWEASDE
tara:strand:+ start:313 stop:657 length:345 start_codon:yes stop_codon:yes gene_type:complete